MKTVQEVLNLAISLGYYRDVGRDMYMCLALEKLLKHKLITQEEYLSTVAEIDIYIDNAITLHYKLYINDLPRNFEDTLTIYSNWSLRPTLTK